MNQELEAILHREDLGPLEQREAVFSCLSSRLDHGFDAAASGLMETACEPLADYLAQHLELFPGRRETKTRLGRRLRREPHLLASAARLVPWFSEDLLQGFVDDYLEQEEENFELESVLFYIGISFPDKLREHYDQIDDKYTRWTLLSGASDVVADRLFEDWQEGGDNDALVDLAYVRTERARAHIRAVREEFEDQAEWETLLQLAGELPDTGRASGHWPAFRGFVLERDAGPHRVGWGVEGEVPLCPVCEEPAAALLQLSRDALPYELTKDPKFYWYTCDCEAMDSITARVSGDSLHVFYGPQGAAHGGAQITPGELSLVLEQDPNQVGVSVKPMPGSGGHQVGGLPSWCEPDLHPRCPDCGNSMPYLATMDCGRTPLGEMSYKGIVYCFWCDGCSVSSTLMQS